VTALTDSGVRVLVVDDERAIRTFLRTALTAQGYVVFEAGSGEEALTSAVANRPDVMILDLGLPDCDGVDVIRRVREWTSLPIIVVSVREQEATKVDALDLGADDYLTKPFGVNELVARLKVALRRTAPPGEDPVFVSDELQVDLSRRQVTVTGVRVSLTPTEYDLLRTLVQHAGKVLTHNQLLRQVWGTASVQEGGHLLRVNISNLRRKLEADPTRPRHILTEPGVGYRLHDGE
jgi:two-component system KDP operon response regulator KdpE